MQDNNDSEKKKNNRREKNDKHYALEHIMTIEVTKGDIWM